jgi:hypothetical protein
MPTLKIFPSVGFALFKFDVMVFVLSYYILLYHVCYLLESRGGFCLFILFSFERQKGSKSGETRCEESLGRVEEREGYLLREKKSIFNKQIKLSISVFRGKKKIPCCLCI